MAMEGKKSPVGVAVAAAGWSELKQGNAETKEPMVNGIQDQQEEWKQQAGEEEDWSGSESGNEEWQLLSLPTMMPLQELVNACHAVLKDSSVPPTDDAVAFIRGAMDKVGLFDVGLMQEVGFFLFRNTGPQNSSVLTCKTIYKCSNFTVMVLYLPKGVAMPLHDHPAMTVFSKLLVGSARVEAFDWVLPRVCAAGPAGSAKMLAEKVRDEEVTAPVGAWVLSPDSGGNRLVAGQSGPCAFINVHVPLYTAAPGQLRCAFYHDLPYESQSNVNGDEVKEEKRRLAWLRKVEEPKDVKVVSLPYRGPPIV